MRTEYIDRVFKRLFQSTTQLMPTQCAVCRSWPTAPVCSDCMARFAATTPRCTTCAIALSAGLAMRPVGKPQQCMDCIKQAPPLDSTLAAIDYAYPWSALISRYKFGQQPGWAPFFADLLLKAPGVNEALKGLQSTDLILPVPLSKERLAWRGFNQAWELAHSLAGQSKSLGLPDSTLLLRVKHTRPQTELLRGERLANVQGAFQIDPLRATALKGKRVLLVDDVMTSGASLYTAASVLRAAGAAHITGVVLARTPQ